MALSTVISSALVVNKTPKPALVLMGGGARTAYQAGVLKAIGSMLALQRNAALGEAGQTAPMPFKVLVGTSAGALNVAYLASQATKGLPALHSLASFWGGLRSRQVWRMSAPRWARWSRWLVALALAREARDWGGALDNMPLVDTLHKSIDLPAVDEALAAGVIDALAVTASSYSTGMHWTFCHTKDNARKKPWERPGRQASFEPITIDHLVASAAIPFIFPAMSLWAGGRKEFFGDGSMRQVSPLSPAMHLGATRILVVGVGQPQRAGLGAARGEMSGDRPGLGLIAGHAMASVFHDTLLADVEQAQRVTNTLKQLPPELAHALPYRSVEVLAISPSQSLDALAQQHVAELPDAARRVLGSLAGNNAAGGSAGLASYLLFEPAFIQALMALGEQDAYARKDELLAFFADTSAPAPV